MHDAIGEETTGATELTDYGDRQDADVFEPTDLAAESFFPERVFESDEQSGSHTNRNRTTKEE